MLNRNWELGVSCLTAQRVFFFTAAQSKCAGRQVGITVGITLNMPGSKARPPDLQVSRMYIISQVMGGGLKA